MNINKRFLTGVPPHPHPKLLKNDTTEVNMAKQSLESDQQQKNYGPPSHTQFSNNWTPWTSYIICRTRTAPINASGPRVGSLPKRKVLRTPLWKKTFWPFMGIPNSMPQKNKFKPQTANQTEGTSTRESVWEAKVVQDRPWTSTFERLDLLSFCIT